MKQKIKTGLFAAAGVLVALLLTGALYVSAVYGRITENAPKIEEKPEGFAESEIPEDPALESETVEEESETLTETETAEAETEEAEEEEEQEEQEEEKENILYNEAEVIYEMPAIDPNTVNILLCGCDEGSVTHSRSDSIMIASYNKVNGTLKLVSILRDSWVPIAGKGTYNRINAAHSYGGVACTINTINNVFHMDLQQYLEVSFDGFKALIDEIGGVDITLYTAEAVKLGVGSEDGTYHLDGDHALRYARERHIGRSDFERAERQRKVIMAAYKKIKSDFDLNAVGALVSFAMNHARTNLSLGELLGYSSDFINNDISITSATVPFKGHWKYATIDKKAVTVIEYKANEKLMKEFLYN